MEKDQPLTVGGNLAAFGQPSVLAESTDLLVFKLFFFFFWDWQLCCYHQLLSRFEHVNVENIFICTTLRREIDLKHDLQLNHSKSELN